jgi:hypothetical protein
LASLLSPVALYGKEGGVDAHWARPARGASKATGPSGLYPEKCAVCHPGQYADWKGALHSKSVGPGLLAQLDHKKDPRTPVSCYFCHAPLIEQSEVVSSPEGFLQNPSFDEKLKSSGVGCAACHLRSGVVTGPLDLPGKASADPPHGAEKKDYFGQAEFCAACHQLETGYELEGKLLVNTYREWKDSVYAGKGVVCQSCHMPGRRHLFRGIHDPGMVRSGVSVEAEKRGPRDAVLRLTNTGAGHYFPTYATPEVVIKGYLADSKGTALKGTLKKAVVGRKVSLDLTEEFFDTRIAPLESYEFAYGVRGVRQMKGAMLVVFEVWVYPDAFYYRFFSEALGTGAVSMDRVLLQKAVEATGSSGYLLFKKEVRL